MPPGGARSRSGPPPDPNALRRDRPGDNNSDWTHLPASGRQGDTPPWPLDRPAQRELGIWEAEWRRPQAIMWEQLGRHHEVAVYVRTLVRFEQEDASVALGTLLRGQQVDLGLSIPGLRANHWVIDSVEPEPDAKPARTNDPDRSSAKARFQRIQGGKTA